MRSAPRLVARTGMSPGILGAGDCATLRRYMSQTTIPTSDAKVVEGSDGLLLEIDGQIVPNYDATFAPFEEGDVVSGRVVRIDNDEVLVDIGYKSEGVIPSNELSIRKNVDPHDEVELGEEVDALVLTKEDQDGRLIMSKKRARFEKAWRRIEAAAECGEPVEGTVIEVVKGGLIIDLGVRGFLPASLVDIRRVPNLDEYMGTKIESKVIELNRSRNNVVLSRRAVLEEERKEQRQEILDRLQPGLVVEGQISNIVDFGAFVDLNGIDGLIHISELSWSHVNHPSEILSIGDTVQVKVLDIDRDRQRISLGLKQTQEDPWQRVVDTYNVGDELEGTVTKVVTFGAFVEILDGVEGLVHISELANHHVENPREVVQPGDDVRVKILEIDSERRRLSLSVKRVEGQVLPRRDAGAGGGRPRRRARARPERGRVRRRRVGAGAGRRATCRVGRRARAEAPTSGEPVGRRRGRRPTSPWPPTTRRRRRARGRRPSDEPVAEEPVADEPEADAPRRRRARGRASPPSRRSSWPSPRAIPFVGLTGGLGAGKSTALAALGAPRRGDDLDRRGRARALRDAPRCATRSSRAGARTSRPGGAVDRSAIARARVRRRRRSARGSRACSGRGSASASRRGARRSPAPSRRRRSPSSRPRCCSRRAWTRIYDATIAVVADEDVRRERAAARGHHAVDERAARQLSAGGEGGPRDVRGRKQRDGRGAHP